MEILISAAVVLFLLLLFPLLVVAIMYNSLVGRRNQVDNIFGTMDAMLKKRWDLVPNLAACVKGYADHERGLFEKVAELRGKAMAGQLSPDQQVALDNLTTRMVGVVQAVAENYPQLKASENFLHLQRTLTELEEQISAARRAYNAAVTDYHNAIDMFPSNLVAGLFSFRHRELFAAKEPERAVPEAGKLLK